MKSLKKLWRQFVKPKFVHEVESLIWPMQDSTCWLVSHTFGKTKDGRWFGRFNLYMPEEDAQDRMANPRNNDKFSKEVYELEDQNAEIVPHRRSMGRGFEEITDPVSIEALEKLTPQEYAYKKFDYHGDRGWIIVVKDPPDYRNRPEHKRSPSGKFGSREL